LRRAASGFCRGKIATSPPCVPRGFSVFEQALRPPPRSGGGGCRRAQRSALGAGRRWCARKGLERKAHRICIGKSEDLERKARFLGRPPGRPKNAPKWVIWLRLPRS
jgi:hypothetical protein